MPGEEVVAAAAPDLMWTLIKIFGPVVAKELFNEFTKDPTALEKFQKSDEYKKFQEIQKIKELKDRYDTLEYSQKRLEDKKKDKAKKWDKSDQKMYDQQKKELDPIKKQLDQYYTKFPQLKDNFEEGYKSMFKEGLSKYQQTQKMLNDEEAAKNKPMDQRFQQYSPEQQQAMSEMLKFVGPEIQSKKFDFDPIAQNARIAFAKRGIPSIAQRFSSVGLDRTGAFPRMLGKAAADLESNLAQLKSDYNLKERGQLSNLFSSALRPQYGYAGPLISNDQQKTGGDTMAELVKLALNPENVSTFKQWLDSFGKKNDRSETEGIVKDYIKKNYGQGGNISSTQKNPYDKEYIFASDNTINNAMDDFLGDTEL